MLRLVFVAIVFYHVQCDLKLSNNELLTFKAKVDSTYEKDKNATFSFEPLHNEVIQITPTSIQVNGNNYSTMGNFTPQSTTSVENGFLLVKVSKSLTIEWISRVIGWMYFFAWAISFYPQMYTNFKRKSVVGLNFDYLFFNIVGYFMYNSFNMGLYFIPQIKGFEHNTTVFYDEQYSFIHLGSLNPVKPNDLFFSTHGILATSVTILQCFIYEKADQSISIVARIIVALYFSVTIIYVILASVGMVLWLDVLYTCSYIKLCVTITKYIPQIYMNYKRKSTRGWSIGAVLLDFIGGLLSILQMVLDGYNYDDWTIIVENPTKFGLGLLTIGFDLVFAFQHYIIYATISNNEKTIQLNIL